MTGKSFEVWVTPGGRPFELIIQATIFVSLLAMSLETVGGLSDSVQLAVSSVSIVTMGIFVLEYGRRIWGSKNPWAYIFSAWGIIDALAIVPAIVFSVDGTTALRSLRLIRLARILKLHRSSRALQRLSRAFVLIRDELVVMLIVAFLVFFIAAAGIYTFEYEAQPATFSSIPAAMWWAVATLTTVGYGDVYPVTVAGKIFTSLILMIGLGLVAVPAGLIAAALQENAGVEETYAETDDDSSC